MEENNFKTEVSKAGGSNRGGAEYCTSNIAHIMVMLPSHLLYFPLSRESSTSYLHCSEAVRETFKVEEGRNKARSEDMECNLEMEN